MLDISNREQLIASIDTLEDAQMAIYAYWEEYKGKERHQGRAYLFLYGLLQAVFLQQDALQHLCEAFSVTVRPSSVPEFLAIREIRNAAIGHPTKRDRGVKNGPHHNSLCRISIRPESFEMMTVDSTGRSPLRTIELIPLLKEHENALIASIENLVVTLKDRISAFKSHFKDSKLADLLKLPPKAVKQQFDLIVQNYPRLDKARVLAFLRELINVIPLVQTEVTGRRIDNDHLTLVCENLDFGLHSVISLLESGTGKLSDVKSSCHRCIKEYKYMHEFCVELDEEFASAP